MLSSTLPGEQEAAAYLESERTDLVVKGPAKSKTIHCLKQMIDKVRKQKPGVCSEGV